MQNHVCDESEGCHIRRGLECDTGPLPWSVVTSGGGVRMRNTHMSHDIFWSAHRSALPTPDLNNLRIRVSLPSHEDTVSGSGLAHNLQVPQYCQYDHDPHV